MLKKITTSICFAAATLLTGTLCAQDTTQAADDTKAGEETIVQTDFETNVVYVHSFAFAGYGLDGEEEGHQIDSKNLTVTEALSATGGNPTHCAQATLDTSNIGMPDDTAWDYVGWAAGVALDLDNPWKDMELGNYTVSFDAKVTGTKDLSSSKMVLNFVVPDDTIGDDEDDFDDIVVGLIRGHDTDGGLIDLTNEYQTFTFNLGDGMEINNGAVADFEKYSVKRINVAVQAQGSSYAIGDDADNVLSIDNVKIVKVK